MYLIWMLDFASLYKPKQCIKGPMFNCYEIIFFYMSMFSLLYFNVKYFDNVSLVLR